MFSTNRTPKLIKLAILMVGLTSSAGFASAQDHSQHQKGMGPFLKTPIVRASVVMPSQTLKLWSNLGTLAYPISTNSPQAQEYFDQGLRLSYAFNHAEALRAFRHAQELDADCALCFWGEALALGPNINAPMNPADVPRALEALASAQAVAGATPREKALIAALATRYSAHPDADRMALDSAYADAMAKVAARQPDDPDIGVLSAEAMMDAQPWDYWQVGADGAKMPKGRTAEIVATLERVLQARPNHAGAIHLYIHAMEASDTPEKAEAYADRLAELMPGAGHLVHMPAHIYYRVGRYVDSLKANVKAAAVDEAFLAEVDDKGIYGGGYYPHNVHFVLTSAQMAGDGKVAIEAADKLASIIKDDVAATVAWVQPVKAAPYFAHAQFGQPDAALALPDPGDQFPYVKGAWHYSRGVAFARKGDIDKALAEAEAIDTLANTADFSFLVSNFVPVDTLMQISRHVLLGRIAQQKGYWNTTLDEFQRAVTLQDSLPYMEPPYWYYPVRQSLGAALLKLGKNEEAMVAFKESLKEAPNSGWALFGLAEAQRALGDEAAAKESEGALANAWAGPLEALDLRRL